MPTRARAHRESLSVPLALTGVIGSLEARRPVSEGEMVKGAYRTLLVLLAVWGVLAAQSGAASQAGSFARAPGVSRHAQVTSACSVSSCGRSRLYVVSFKGGYNGAPDSNRCMADGATPEQVDPTSGAVSQPGAPWRLTAAARPGGDRLLLAQSSGMLSLANADGSGSPRVIPGVRSSGFCMRASLDATASGLSYLGTNGHIHFVRLSGGSKVDKDLGVNGVDPQLSPDGRWIADFASVGVTELIHPDGTGLRMINSPGLHGSVRWFPDSRRLAYLGNRPSACASAVTVTDTVTGASTLVPIGLPACPSGAAGQYFIPQDLAVSPDGNQLAIAGGTLQCSPASGYPAGCPGGELGDLGLFAQAVIVIIPATGGSPRVVRKLTGSCTDPANQSCVDPAGGPVAAANHAPGFALTTLWWGPVGCATPPGTADLARAHAAGTVTMSFNGRPIGTPSVCLVAGTPVVLSVSAGANVRWRIQGLTTKLATTSAVAQYKIVHPGLKSHTQGAFISTKARQRKSLRFYFMRPNARGFRVSVRTSQGSSTKTFIVSAPVVSDATIRTCKVDLSHAAATPGLASGFTSWVGPGANRSCAQVFGIPGLHGPFPGIHWAFTIAAAGTEAGRVGMVQVISEQVIAPKPPTPVRVEGLADTSAFWDELAKPKSAFTKLTPNGSATWSNSDSPHLELGVRISKTATSFRVGTWYESFFARDYLMFQSSVPGSVWVPIGGLNWSWYVRVTRSNLGAAWSLVAKRDIGKVAFAPKVPPPTFKCAFQPPDKCG